MLVLVLQVPLFIQGQAGVERRGQCPRTQRHIYITSFRYVRQNVDHVASSGSGNTNTRT